MNLRQKAKYYKQRCEMLEKLTLPHRPPFRYADTEQPIVTLCSEQRLPLEEYADMRGTNNMRLAMIEKNMGSDFMHQLLKYAQVVVQRDDWNGCVVIKATMNVVDMRNE